jgi:hypothetical protein
MEDQIQIRNQIKSNQIPLNTGKEIPNEKSLKVPINRDPLEKRKEIQSQKEKTLPTLCQKEEFSQGSRRALLSIQEQGVPRLLQIQSGRRLSNLHST